MEKVVDRKGGCYPHFDSYKKGCGGFEGGVYFTNINVAPDERSGSEQHTKKYNFMKDIRRMESTVKILSDNPCFQYERGFRLCKIFLFIERKKSRAGCNLTHHIEMLLFRKRNICVYNFSNKDVFVVVLSVKPTAVLFVINIGSHPGRGKDYFSCHKNLYFHQWWNRVFQNYSLCPFGPQEILRMKNGLWIFAHVSYNILNSREGFWNRL